MCMYMFNKLSTVYTCNCNMFISYVLEMSRLIMSSDNIHAVLPPCEQNMQIYTNSNSHYKYNKLKMSCFGRVKLMHYETLE